MPPRSCERPLLSIGPGRRAELFPSRQRGIGFANSPTGACSWMRPIPPRAWRALALPTRALEWRPSIRRTMGAGRPPMKTSAREASQPHLPAETFTFHHDPPSRPLNRRRSGSHPPLRRQERLSTRATIVALSWDAGRSILPAQNNTASVASRGSSRLPCGWCSLLHDGARDDVHRSQALPRCRDPHDSTMRRSSRTK